MLNYLTILFICISLFACGNTNNEKQATSDNDAQSDTAGGGPSTNGPGSAGVESESNAGTNVNAKGYILMASSDCVGCHKERDKLVGPSYLEIASKYSSNEKDIKMLSEKILKGSAGIWGNVPMAPHPTLTIADAKEMVKYILTIK